MTSPADTTASPASAASSMPAISLIAVPGRRTATVELARKVEQAGFSGIWCPSYGDPMALCQEIARATSHIVFGTSIQPIYLRHANDLAGHAAFLHELSGGRFHLGLGVSHNVFMDQLGVTRTKPLADQRAYVAQIRKMERQHGAMPPIVLATLRDKMLDLAVEIGQGAVWANASVSAIGTQAARARSTATDGFFLGNMLPTVINEDRDAARAVHRKTLTGYVQMENYRNYWRASGFADEMDAIEAALAAGDRTRLTELMPDHWLDDVTLSGTAAQVRDGAQRWIDAGVTPILVPSAVSGGQLQAFDDLFRAYA
jgi:alkanesulfonate monooxygenase SsuD/methylene tetrahydromethanopterin reductase-like flavin-dependent oxidoreductase (luciferase family)